MDASVVLEGKVDFVDIATSNREEWVVNDVTLSLVDAKKLCKKILDKKYQCLIVMDT